MLGLLASLVLAEAVLAVSDLGTVLSQHDNLSTYSALLKSYPDVLLQLPSYNGITVLAPDDTAFARLGTAWDATNATLAVATLQYHILQGTVATAAVPIGPTRFEASLLTSPDWTNVTGGQNVVLNKQPGDVVVFTSGDGSRSTLTSADIPFAGGLVQVIDSLLVPPSSVQHTARDAYTDLTAFLAALYRANLTTLFATTPDATILAPRNEAFESVAGALEKLDADDLAKVLRYHLIPGSVVPSSALTNGTKLTTAATGKTVRVVKAGNNLYFDTAQLVQPDILVANGVVHMIDNVLDPFKSAAKPDPTLAVQPAAFQTGAAAASTAPAYPFAAYLPCTSACPVTTTSTNGSTATGTGSITISTATGTETAVSQAQKGGAARMGVSMLLANGLIFGMLVTLVT